MDEYQRLRDALRDRLSTRVGQAWARRLLGGVLLGSDLSVLIVRLLADERLSASDRGTLLGGLRSPLGAGSLGQAAKRVASALHFTFNKLDPCAVADNWPGDPELLARAQGVARRADRLAVRGWRAELEEALLRPGALLRHLPPGRLVNALYTLRGITPLREVGSLPVVHRGEG